MENCRRGFTLVELAIVLVIIGLLIGGILATQTMIATVRIQSHIKQIQQFDIIVSNFQTKYGQLPGDSDLFAPPGNKNGVIDSSLGSGGIDYLGCCWGPTVAENANFWKHLSDSGMVTDTYTNNLPNGNEAGVNAPRAKMGAKGTIIVGAVLVNSPPWGYANETPTDHYWVICYNSKGTSAASYSLCGSDNSFYQARGPLTPAEALAIDTKADDGNPTSGNIYAANDHGQNPTYLGIGAYYPCTTLAPDNPASKYYLDNTDIGCGLKFRMGLFAGK